MAMTKCKECGASISTKAEACPQCGAKAPKETSRWTILFGGLFAIFVASMVFGEKTPTPAPVVKTKAQIEEEQRQARIFDDAVKKLRMFKASLKNPASFELVTYGRLDNGTFCIIYRGTNSFNAVTTEHKAITPIGAIADFDKHCGGKSAEDFTKAKYAL